MCVCVCVGYMTFAQVSEGIIRSLDQETGGGGGGGGGGGEKEEEEELVLLAFVLRFSNF